MEFIYGPNVDILLPIDVDQVVDSGATWFRAPLRLDAPAPATAERLVARGLKFLGVVDRTTGKAPAAYYAPYDGLVAGIQITNEWDHVGPSSMGYMSHEEVLDWRLAWWDFAPIDVMGGMADGRAEVLTPAFAAVWKYSAFHPYGRRPVHDWPSQTWGFGSLRFLAEQYHQAAPDALFIASEFGVQTDQLGPRDRTRFYVETLRALVSLPFMAGAFPFGLNNGAGGGADLFRLTQGDLDAMRAVIDEIPDPGPIPPDPQPPTGGSMKLEALAADYGGFYKGKPPVIEAVDPVTGEILKRSAYFNRPPGAYAVELYGEADGPYVPKKD